MSLCLAPAPGAHAKERLALLGVDSASLTAPAEAARLVIDAKVEKDLDLSRMRTTRGGFEPPDEEDANPREPARDGLEDVRASGSSQFSERGLAQLLGATGRPLVIVDLREESHGLLNGLPVSWASADNDANRGLSLDEVRAAEKAALAGLLRQRTARVLRPAKRGPGEELMITVKSVMTEKKLCRGAGVAYVRIPVTDHRRPLDEDVDRFLALVRKAPRAWLHVHCKAGKGRTTTFLAMLDMVKNARRLSAEEIVYRQHRLGGSNLLEGTPDEGEEATARERAAFLRRFHAYCRANRDGFETSWSRWLAGQSSSSPSATLPSLR